MCSPLPGRWRATPARCSPAAICNTIIYDPKDPTTIKNVRAMFEEQVGRAVNAGVDFIIGETFGYMQEALLALEVIKQVGQAAVITLAAHKGPTRDGWSWATAALRLKQAGADALGLNRTRGPSSMLPLLAQIRKAVKCMSRCCQCHIAPRGLGRRFTHSPIMAAAACPAAMWFRSRSTRSLATTSRSPSSVPRPMIWASTISASTAVPVHIT